MKRSDRWTNALLALLAAVLLALCVRSVLQEQQSVAHTQQLKDGRDQ